MGPSVSAYAQAVDVFTVRSVPVDARAADELTAKSVGIAAGQKSAFNGLLRRLTLQADHDRLPSVDDKAVTQLVRDYSIEGEKFGGGRYIASLTARFKPDGVRSLLRRAEIPFAETASQPILVLPVFQTAGASSLWDDPNPWYTAWAGLPRSDGLLPLVIPVGDLSDVAVIGAEQAVQGQAERLIEIGSKYDARNVMVVTATLRISPGNGALALETLSSVYHDGEARQTTIRRFDSVPGQSRDDLLAGAAAALSVEANESWKRENLLDEGSASNMAVRVPLSGLDNWLDIRGKLRGIAGMKEVAVDRLSTSMAELRLSFTGSPSQFRLALAQHDLDLQYDLQEAAWTIRSGRVR